MLVRFFASVVVLIINWCLVCTPSCCICICIRRLALTGAAAAAACFPIRLNFLALFKCLPLKTCQIFGDCNE